MIYSSWDIEQNILKLLISSHFCPLSSFYTCVPKTTIIWCMIPEIRSETDIIFCHFGPFFALLHTPLSSPQWSRKSKFWNKLKKMPGDIILLYIRLSHKWRSYDIWFLKYKVQQTEIFIILGHFLPFQPLDNLQNQNFNIEKNTWRYYHFTHLHH